MAKSKYSILFEDNDIVVIDKPAGMLTIPDRFSPAENLRALLSSKYGQIFVVHRLDRETSGVLVFAKNAEAHRNLSIQFENHTVTKIYSAVISGQLAEDELSIDIPLMPDPVHKGLMRPSARGKDSLTIMKVIERYRIATHVECDLRTGRQHQIRVHSASIGHPLLVDSLYGKSEAFLLSTIKRRYNLQKNEEEKPIISRITLHSKTLGFKHPSTGADVEFTSELPKDFKALLSVLRKYSAIPTITNKFQNSFKTLQ